MKQKAVLYGEISGETEKASQKHTPGPWVIHEAGTYRYPEVIIPNGREVIAAAINGKANARLIATAPDLLEELELALPLLEDAAKRYRGDWPDTWQESCEWLAALRIKAVIAKAKGEEHKHTGKVQ